MAVKTQIIKKSILDDDRHSYPPPPNLLLTVANVRTFSFDSLYLKYMPPYCTEMCFGCKRLKLTHIGNAE